MIKIPSNQNVPSCIGGWGDWSWKERGAAARVQRGLDVRHQEAHPWQTSALSGWPNSIHFSYIYDILGYLCSMFASSSGWSTGMEGMYGSSRLILPHLQTIGVGDMILARGIVSNEFKTQKFEDLLKKRAIAASQMPKTKRTMPASSGLTWTSSFVNFSKQLIIQEC